MIRTCSSGPGRSSSSHAARASTSFSQCLADLLFTAMILSFPATDHISAPHRQNLEGWDAGRVFAGVACLNGPRD